jgi:hypothetical protein
MAWHYIFPSAPIFSSGAIGPQNNSLWGVTDSLAGSFLRQIDAPDTDRLTRHRAEIPDQPPEGVQQDSPGQVKSRFAEGGFLVRACLKVGEPPAASKLQGRRRPPATPKPSYED